MCVCVCVYGCAPLRQGVEYWTLPSGPHYNDQGSPLSLLLFCPSLAPFLIIMNRAPSAFLPLSVGGQWPVDRHLWIAPYIHHLPWEIKSKSLVPHTHSVTCLENPLFYNTCLTWPIERSGPTLPPMGGLSSCGVCVVGVCVGVCVRMSHLCACGRRAPCWSL